MKNSLKYIVFLCLVTLVFASCSEYSKVVKGSDYPTKLKMANELKESGDCYKALTLYDELMTFYRLSDKAENVYYSYAQTHYCLKDFYLASYYFHRFTKNFPNSPRVEECAYMSALCTKENSPDYNLDPTETKKAISEFQLFLDRFPNSSRVDTCNYMISELRSKLERKSYEQGKLYYKMEQYNSAVVAFETTLRDYPDTKYREELMFLSVKAAYLLASNSIQIKKQERFDKTIESYRIFADYFKDSKYMKDATNYFESSEKALNKLTENK
jgi:outer membrane protein assembly factor BamD